MNPQPPVTNSRTSPDNSGSRTVKHHATGAKGATEIARLAPVHAKQVLTQLRLTGLKLGLLINFGEAHLKNGIKRVIKGQLENPEAVEVTL